MNISIVGNALNILLGITLVYGLFGAPKLGVVGVGIARLTDRTLMGIAMAWYVPSAPRFKVYLVHFRQRYLVHGCY